MTKTLLEKYAEDPAHMRLLQQELAILEVTGLLEAAMRQAGVSRAELAKRLGKSRGWITQLLHGQANKTIRTVADAFAVLGQEFHCFNQPIQITLPSTVAGGGNGVITLNVPDEMLARLKEHVEGGDYCYLCDCHPGVGHYHHDPACPLLVVCSHERVRQQTVGDKDYPFCDECDVMLG